MPDIEVPPDVTWIVLVRSGQDEVLRKFRTHNAPIPQRGDMIEVGEVNATLRPNQEYSKASREHKDPENYWAVVDKSYKYHPTEVEVLAEKETYPAEVRTVVYLYVAPAEEYVEGTEELPEHPEPDTAG